MSDKGINLTEAGAEFGGRPITGALHYANKERRRVAVTLEGAEIDAGQFWPAGVGALKRVLSGGGAAPEVKFAWLDPNTTDLQLRLRTGQLIGSTDRLGAEAKDRPVHFQEVFATLYHRLGIDVSQFTLPDLTGRPQYMVDRGYQPIREVI